MPCTCSMGKKGEGSCRNIRPISPNAAWHLGKLHVYAGTCLQDFSSRLALYVL